jgi:hypothetical protein
MSGRTSSSTTHGIPCAAGRCGSSRPSDGRPG